MDLGQEVVSSVLRDRNLRPYLQAGFTRDWVLDRSQHSGAVFTDEWREAYLHILEHYATHRTTPTREIMDHNFGRGVLRYSKSEYSPSEVVALCLEEVRADQLAEAFDSVRETFQNGRITDAYQLWLKTAAKLKKGPSDQGQLVNLTDPDYDLQERLNRVVPKGMLTGIKNVDDTFGGAQPGQLVTYLGRQKSTKTSSLLFSALKAWTEGFSPMVYSVEMTDEDIRDKVFAMGSHVNSEKIRKGMLRNGDRRHVEKFWEEMIRDHGCVDFLVHNKRGKITVDQIASDIEQHNPHVVYVDGFYFMKDTVTGKTPGSDWQANDNVAEELKALALEKQIPIFVSHQVREKQHNKRQKGIDPSSIMGGTGLSMASDLILGFDADHDSGKVWVNCVYSRYVWPPDLVLTWDWDRMEFEEALATDDGDFGDHE